MTPDRWQQVNELYHAALERAASQRAAFLTAACAGDEALRRDVESLIASHEQAASFLAAPALEAVAKVVAADHAQSRVGRRLGSYEILTLLGVGGMGEVYRARDTKLDRTVAIKILPAEVAADRDRMRRFTQEARAASALNHPNISHIYELGEADGLSFIAMEYVEGQTLATKISGGPLDPAELVDIALQVADALDEAQSKRITHRDIKPPNLMLTPRGQVKVLDFGLAKVARPDGQPAASGMTPVPVTTPGLVMGTVEYMSPEQVLGRELDHRTDLFSLGVVLYEMATGRKPFSGATATETMDRILHAQPDPVAHFNDQVPADLEHIIRTCLEKDRERRYQSARDLSSDLQNLKPDLQKPARGPRPRKRTWSWFVGGRERFGTSSSPFTILRRNPLVTLVVGTVITVLAVAAGLTRLYSGHTTTSLTGPVTFRRTVAVLGFKNLSGRPDSAWLSTAFAEMLTTELAAGERLRTIPGENVARMKSDLALPDAESFAEDTLARIRGHLGTDLVVLGSYVAVGENLRLDLRVQDAAAGETIATVTDRGREADLLELVSRTGARLREALGVELSAAAAASVRAAWPSNPTVARFYADGLGKLRQFDALGAKDLLEKAVAADPTHSLTHSALAAAWAALGYDERAKEEAKRAFDLSGKLPREEQLWIEGRYRETNNERDRAVEIYRTLFSFFPDNLDYGLRLAAAQTSAGKGKEALATIEGLRGRRVQVADDPRIDLAEAEAAASLSDFKQQQAAAARASANAAVQGARLLVARARTVESVALQQLGEPKQALAVGEEAKRIYAAAGDRGGEARATVAIGVVLRGQGDLAGARRVYEQALATYHAIGNRSGVAAALNNIANLLRQQGQLAGAKKLYEESLAISREIGDRAGEARALNNLAIALRQQGNLTEALEMYRQTLVIRRAIGEKDGVASTLYNMANVLRQQGDSAAAKKMYEEALTIWREVGDKGSIAATVGGLATLLFDQGDLAAARKMYEEALPIWRQVGDKSGAASALNNLALVQHSQGDLAGSQNMFEAALATWREMGDKTGRARALSNLAYVLADLGDLAEAKEKHEEALELSREVGGKRGMAFAHFGIGQIFSAQGNVSAGRQRHQQALALREEIGEKDTISESRLALATLSVEEGRAVEAEPVARRLIEAFRAQNAHDGEVTAHAILARALHAQGKLADAQEAIARGRTLSEKSQNRLVRLSLAIAAARVDAAAGRHGSATKSLETTIVEAERTGLAGLQLEARLALGEAEVAAGNAKAGRTRLEALERDATVRGFGLIARKAAAARR